jgi:hypothetical protein
VLPEQPARVPPFKLQVKKGRKILNQKTRRISAESLRSFCKEEITKLINSKVLVHSSSPVGSPVILAKKPSLDPSKKNYRLCADLKNVNENTEPRGCSIPNIRDSLNVLRGKRYYAKLDMTMGYHQCEVDKDSRWILAINTISGKFEYLRVPFGPQQAPGYFQDIMGNFVFVDFEDKNIVYFDDIVVFGVDFEDYLNNLEATLVRLIECGLVLRPGKCTFATKSVEYCGFTVDRDKYAVKSDRIDAIKNFYKPTTIKQLRRFLGMTNQLRDFCKNYALIEKRLTRLYKTSQPKQRSKTKIKKQVSYTVKLKWDNDSNEAYRLMLDSISNAVALHHIDYNQPLHLQVDASILGVGGVLFQYINDVMYPIQFIALAFNPTQSKWQTLEQEAFAVYHNIVVCHHYLVGQHFYVHTDHKNLLYILKTETPKVVRWRLRLQEYFFSVLHIAGVDNIIADTQSRQFEGEKPKDVETDDNVNNNITQVFNINSIEYYSSKDHVYHINLIENVAYKDQYTEEDKLVIFNSLHNGVSGHRGSTAMIRDLTTAGYKWDTLREDVVKFVQSCPTCQKVWQGRQGVIDELGILEVYEPFQQISVDFQQVSSEPDEYGYKYLCNFIDDMTGNVELVPCKSIDAEELARCYVQVFGRYGASQYIKTDNAAAMEADLIKQFIELIESECKHSISHRHESNGVIEHSNRECIRHLKAIVHELKDHKKWSKYTMLAQRVINATVSSVTKVSPSQLLYGNMITLDRGLFKSYKLKSEKPVHTYLKDLLEMQQKLVNASQIYLAKNKDKKVAKDKIKNKNKKPTSYKVGDYVLVSYPDNKLPNKLDTKWYGPMKVVKTNRSQYYLVDLVTGTTIDRHSSFLKPYIHSDKNVSPYQVAMRDKQEYLVDKLVAHRLVSEIAGVNNKTSYEFKVRWLGYTALDDTWLPWKEVRDLEAMDRYLRNNKTLAKLIKEKVDQ